MARRLFLLSVLWASASYAQQLPYERPGITIHTPSQTVAANPAKNDFRIVPGYRIGRVRLAMSRAEAVKVMPRKFVSRLHGYGVEELLSSYTSSLNGLSAKFQVLLLQGKVVQIAVDDDAYKIVGGYGSGTMVHEFKAAFPGFTSKTFYTNSGDTVYFYDNISQGLSVPSTQSSREISAMIGVNWERPEFVAVHTKGQRALAIWNGERYSSKAPPPPKPRYLHKIVLSPKQRSAAQRVLRSLRRLEEVVKVGTTYSDYSNRVVDTRLVIAENIGAIPPSDLRSELAQAMDEFVNARTSWNGKFESDNRFIDNLNESMMQGAWQRARAHIRNAEKLLR
jgi:hypothetical protein